MGACMSVDEETQRIEIGWRVWEARKERRRRAQEVAAAEKKAADLLAGMPGRLCRNGVTRSCCLHSRQGAKGPVNQDSMLVWEGFASNREVDEHSVFCGIFDGHGPNGHHVAKKVRDALPSILLAGLHEESVEEEAASPDHGHLQAADGQLLHDHDPAADDHEPADEGRPRLNHGRLKGVNADSVDKQPSWTDRRFIAAFAQMDECLQSHPNLNCTSSGTTAIATIIQGQELIVGNVGDSRAILARREDDGTLVVDQLTIDLKPDLPGEKERIKTCNGRVFAMRDEPHVARIWLPHMDSPGLAMARALGDFCLKDYGLISTPQISRRTLTHYHEFMILATDGVWDVLSNDEVTKIVSNCKVKEEAAKIVVDEATKRWRKKERAMEARMDDCAVVCHFFNRELNQCVYTRSRKGKIKFPILDFKSDHKFNNLNILERGKTQREYISNDQPVVVELAPTPLVIANEHVERGV